MLRIIPLVLWLTGDLRPAGRVAHLDDRPDVEPPISWFQHAGHWSEPEVIDSEMAGAGYRRIATFDFLPTQSFQVFAPGSPSPSLAESGR